MADPNSLLKNLDRGDVIMIIQRVPTSPHPKNAYMASTGVYGGNGTRTVELNNTVFFDQYNGRLKSSTIKRHQFSIDTSTLIYADVLMSKKELTEFAQESFIGSIDKSENGSFLTGPWCLAYTSQVDKAGLKEKLDESESLDILAVAAFEMAGKYDHAKDFPLRILTGFTGLYSWDDAILTLDNNFKYREKKNKCENPVLRRKDRDRHNEVKLFTDYDILRDFEALKSYMGSIDSEGVDSMIIGVFENRYKFLRSKPRLAVNVLNLRKGTEAIKTVEDHALAKTV